MQDVTWDTVRRVDRSKMMEAVLDLPGQVERALAKSREVQVTLPRAPKSIVLAGLGGSAIAGDFLAHLLARDGTVPAVVARDYTLPAWAGRDTLVLCASYSGTTEETLAAFVEAKKRGCMIAAASTGATLEAFARKAGASFLPMEPGLQPRAAIGASIVPQAWALESAGVLKTSGALADASRAMRTIAASLSPDSPPERNEAKRIALALRDRIPFVYGSELFAPVARRLSNQFSENSKTVSAWGIVPEMNHNESVGWSGETHPGRFAAVLLRHDGEHPQTRERFAFVADSLKGRGVEVVESRAPGTGALPQMLASTFVGDAASVYLAAIRGVDPSPVEVIKDLKARLAKTGFASRLAVDEGPF